MPSQSACKYVVLDGWEYGEKPEFMTQLKGNALVPNIRPRIVLRGKLDSLAARILEAQTASVADGKEGVAKALQEIMDGVSMVLMGGVGFSPGEFCPARHGQRQAAGRLPQPQGACRRGSHVAALLHGQ